MLYAKKTDKTQKGKRWSGRIAEMSEQEVRKKGGGVEGQPTPVHMWLVRFRRSSGRSTARSSNIGAGRGAGSWGTAEPNAGTGRGCAVTGLKGTESNDASSQAATSQGAGVVDDP